jgi:hypothetical protein
MRGAVFAVLALLLASCGSSTTTAPQASAPSSSTPLSTASSSSVAAAASSSDQEVCTGSAGLEKNGDGFYQTYRHIMLTGQGMTVDALTLTGQLRTLAQVGKRGEETNGIVAINEASPDVRLAMSQMVNDANRFATQYTDVTNGLPVSSADTDLTPMINTYTSSLVECTKAGFKPSYFDPNELSGH